MPKTTKRKVRRLHPRSKAARMGVLFAPIIGEYSGKLYHFVPLDIREPVPFPSLEREVYLRV
jgi:hypothetical protein